MSDAPIGPVPSSQLPAKKPEVAASGSVTSPTSAGGGEKSAPAVEDPDKQTRARTVSADLGQSTEPAAEGDVSVVELAVVEAAVEPAIRRDRSTVRQGGTAPGGSADEEQGNEELPRSESPRQEGYGTFPPPEPAQSEGAVGTSSTVYEETPGPSDAGYTRDLSDWMVFANLMKASMGTGILAMPMAMRNAGYAVGPLMFACIALICTHCIHLLVNSSRALRRRLMVPTLEYADTAGAAFETSRSRVVQCMAPFARGFTEVFLAVYMIGACSVYVLFVKENLKQLFDVSCKENEWTSIDYLLHLALVLVVLVGIPSLSSLSVVSLVANVTMIVGVFMCIGVISHSLPRQAPQLEYNKTTDTWSNITVQNVTYVPWAGWERMPLFFGTAVFALEGIGVVLTLENQMRDATRFLNNFGVLNIAMGLIAVLYLVIGILGYLAYGETTKGSITLNLPPDSTMAFWVRKLVTLAIFLTYPLQFYIPEEIVWKWLLALTRVILRVVSYQPLFDWAGQCTTWQGTRFLFKVLLMLATVCLPLAVPRLGPAIALVGAVCLSMLGLILPTVINAITHWEDILNNRTEPRMVLKIILHCFIVIMGITGLVTGAYSSIEELKELNAATE